MSSIAASQAAPQAGSGVDSAPAFAWRTIVRHRWPLRLMHWLNLLCMLAMVGSGLQIYNAHPALYWGEASHFDTPLFATKGVTGADGKLRGFTQIGGRRFETTGVLGVATGADGQAVRGGFPGWSTIPGWRNLAFGRRWHLFFAWAWVINGVCYLAWSLASRHLSRDLAMRRRDWRALPRSVVDHLRFRHPVGEAAARYNPLQKLAYLGVIFALTPLIVVTGLSMSPQMDTVMGWWLDLVGGRQSSRTLHFVAMSGFVLFTVVHVLMVVYAGPINELRSMISGRFRIRVPADTAVPAAAAADAAAQPVADAAATDGVLVVEPRDAR